MNGYGRLRRPISNGVKKTFELVWGVIRRPAPTFRRIKEEKPFKEGLIICLFSTFFYSVIVYLLIPKAFLTKVESITKFIPPRALVFYDPILVLLFLLIVAALFNLFARLLKGSSNFKTLLIAFFCISALNIIESPLLFGTSLVKSEIGYKIILYLFALWGFILWVIAIRETFNFSWGKSILSFVLSVLCFLILMVVAGIIFGFYQSKTSPKFKKFRILEAQAKADTLAVALELYKLDCEIYPLTGEGLRELVENKADRQGWSGPYWTKFKRTKAGDPTIPDDPWGQDYEYRSDGETFTVWSKGPDRKSKTADDIIAPEY